MDGSFKQVATELARLLAEVETIQGGLTTERFELLVRVVWQMTGEQKDPDEVKCLLQQHLAALQGLDFSVSYSRLLREALDVSCRFIFAGTQVTHTVHLW